MKAAHPVGAEHRRVLVLYLGGDVLKSENDKCLAHASQTLDKKFLGRRSVLFQAVWFVLEFAATIVEELMLKDDELLLLWMDFSGRYFSLSWRWRFALSTPVRALRVRSA